MLREHETPRGQDPSEVMLVSMPFGPVFSPSLGLTLLQAQLAARGRASRIAYFTIPFAERIGQALYSQIAVEGKPSMRELAGEWIFSGAVFPSSPEEEEAYLDEVLRGGAAWMDGSGRRPVSEATVARIRAARRAVDPFLDECLEQVLRARPRLVGFTSVFQQHLASLALARRLKREAPETVVVFGGANCEEVMGAETVRQFPFVDAAVSGEGELVFPELVERVLSGRPLSGLPGVRTREGLEAAFRAGRFGTAPMVKDMDALPYPDFGDYFEQFGGSRFGREWQPGVFFESSRGCWWGERSHCTFCGLNGTTMAFRSKSAGRALRELSHLAERHPGCDVQVVDNILDMAYFRDLLPELKRKRIGLELFYETKANLRKDQVRLLRDAGVATIQPGIESLSDSVLRLMRKGVSALQNVQLLKWCKELGVRPVWNLLWGFPGEDPAEYARMARLVPALAHLTPPVAGCDLRLDRFSPNFSDAERLGFTDVRPLAPYRHLYPGVADEALANLAYFFSFRYREPRDVAAYAGPLVRALRAWRKAHASSDLFAVDLEGTLLLWDLRPPERRPLAVLRDAQRGLYLACDAASDTRALAGAHRLSPAAVEDALEPLVEQRLMLRDGSRYLALAVPLGEYVPSEEVARRFYDVAAALGRRQGRRLRVELPEGTQAPPRAAPGRRRRSPAPAAPLDAAHFHLSSRDRELVIDTALRERRA